MSHNLMLLNGRASLCYAGETPWHGLGTRLDRPATAAEAIAAAGLGWTVSKAPLRADTAAGPVPVPDAFAVLRDGVQPAPVLGVVGRDYTPLQNAEAFAFFDPLVGQDAAIYHTAGALGRGERVWLLAKLPGQVRVVGDDIAEKYLLLANSHDGRGSVQIRFTPVRVVCQNTLALALRGDGQFRVVHTPDVKQRLQEAGRLLAAIQAGYADLELALQAMCRVPMDQARLGTYLAEVFPHPGDDDEAAVERVRTAREGSARLFDEGRGNRLPGVAGTLWAAYNGVTEYLDHRRTRQSPGRRLASLWFGEGHRVKARAHRAALALLGPAGN